MTAIDMEEYINNIDVPESLLIKPIALNEPFMDFARRLADEADTVLLASGGSQSRDDNDGWDCDQYHILAARPWLVLKTRGNNIALTIDGHEKKFVADPLTVLRTILSRLNIRNLKNTPDNVADLPVAAGLFGYFSYDLKDCLEKLPRTCVDDLYLPDIYLVAPRLLLVHDRHSDTTTACVPVFADNSDEDPLDGLAQIQQTPAPAAGQWQITSNFCSNFTKDEYQDAVSAIIDYIAAGDVYQVNLSQRFETGFSGRPWPLFVDLLKKNPAAFFAYINAGDHHILSTSPERFIKQTGDIIETRPIKGTRPRGKTRDQDEKNRQELLNSFKDEAELSMIVDLLRNDIGKVCQPGSVRVSEHKRLEAYDNVFHLVSIVEGTLKENTNAADIVGATFPGGSITGCPKIRSMEIIDELEPSRRHIYTGSIGYISFHDTMDLSIAIRTATICGGKLFYSAGGGIVYDSTPLDEYNETLAKAATMLDTFTSDAPASRHYVWLNGKLEPRDTATVPLNSPGVQYGTGLFETIRADNGQPGFLTAHIERLRNSWQVLFSTPFPDVNWEDIIRQVLKANDLNKTTAAVKIIAAHGDREQPPFNHTLAVMARPYTHRLEMLNRAGLDLATYPHPRQIMTANHKTLNYFFYKQAGDWAKKNNADEALILNPDNTISETNTANLMLVSGNTISVPQSSTVLSGIMQTAVLELLKEKGFQIIERKVSLDDCFKADTVILTNSLIGAVPVLSIDGRAIAASATELWQGVNKIVLTSTQHISLAK